MKHIRSSDYLAIRHFWILCLQHKALFWSSWLTPIATIGSGVVIPFYIGKILGSLAEPDSRMQPLLIGLVVTALLTVIINYIGFKSYFELQPRVMADLETEALDVLVHRGTRFHNNRVSGKLVSDVNDYSMGFLQFSNAIFIDALPFAAIVVTGIILVAISSPLLALVLAAMTGLVVLWTIHFRNKMRPYRHKRQAAGKKVIGHIADAIVNNQTVKTFGNELFEIKLHKKLGRKLMQLRIRDWNMMAIDGTQRLGGLFLFEIIFVIILILEVRHNPGLLATGIFAFSYTVTLSNRLFQIGNMMRQLEESLLQISPMIETLHETVEIVDEPDALQLIPAVGKVTLRSVSFHYRDTASKESIFDDLTISIQGGEKIGLVGPSGGGKSTLTKLLLRFEDIDSGQIMIDDQDIARVTQKSLRRSIAYVSQEPLLFHRSIRDNIAYGNPKASEDQVHDAARKAYADSFINKLPDGYDTVVGERGIKLSGGQRQRIAIARAILKDAPILILDEATSALDSESENMIQNALAQLMEHKTAIVIAHRLSTIQKLDRIIVIDEGKVIEQGSHNELLRRNGLYATLWNRQSGGFIED